MSFMGWCRGFLTGARLGNPKKHRLASRTLGRLPAAACSLAHLERSTLKKALKDVLHRDIIENIYIIELYLSLTASAAESSAGLCD